MARRREEYGPFQATNTKPLYRGGGGVTRTKFDTYKRQTRSTYADRPLRVPCSQVSSRRPFLIVTSRTCRTHHPPRSDPSSRTAVPHSVRRAPWACAPLVHLCPAVSCVRRTSAGPSTCFAFGAAVRTSLSSVGPRQLRWISVGSRQSLSNMQENSCLENSTRSPWSRGVSTPQV